MLIIFYLNKQRLDYIIDKAVSDIIKKKNIIGSNIKHTLYSNDYEINV